MFEVLLAAQEAATVEDGGGSAGLSFFAAAMNVLAVIVIAVAWKYDLKNNEKQNAAFPVLMTLNGVFATICTVRGIIFL